MKNKLETFVVLTPKLISSNYFENATLNRFFHNKTLNELIIIDNELFRGKKMSDKEIRNYYSFSSDLDSRNFGFKIIKL